MQNNLSLVFILWHTEDRNIDLMGSSEEHVNAALGWTYFSKPGDYITQNATRPLSEITGE